MAHSFLYLAVTGILQLIRLGRRDCDLLAIEVVMLRRALSH
jgi:hypothetical protein